MGLIGQIYLNCTQAWQFNYSQFVNCGMNILLVAATELEIKPIVDHLNALENSTNIVDVLVTGAGMTATAFAMGKALCSKKYDLAINAGIAGAFDRSLKVGEVVNVNLDIFAELGAEDGENFISIDALGFGSSGIKPVKHLEHQTLAAFRQVKAITVNKVHGNDESIYSTSIRLNPQTESMEGAAFFFACNKEGLECLQLRAISNYVERRNRANWNIELAVENLNRTLIELLNHLS